MRNLHIQRTFKDLTDILKDPLTENKKIFISKNDDNILEFDLLVVGPDDAPYEGSFLIFKFKINDKFPHKAPSVTFMTNDSKGRVRLHPNFYVDGKVCLSVLGTWQGPGWTSCTSLLTVIIISVKRSKFIRGYINGKTYNN